MIKNKKARRTAKTLKCIKLNWIKGIHWKQVSLSSQRFLSCKHMHDYDPEKARLEAIDYMEKIDAYNKKVNMLYKQMNKLKLK